MRNARSWIVTIAALGLGACAAPRPAARAPKYVTPAAFYIPEERLQAIALAPAPGGDSDTERQDLAALKDWQAKRTARDCARADSEANPNYDTFFGSQSPFSRPMPKEAAEFFAHVRDDAFHITDAIKRKYNRPRPYIEDSSLHPCVPTPKEDGYAYPSGHATLSRVFGLVLSDLVPERRAEFMARADEVALDRVLGGVHHPSDIAAGKLLGDEIHAELRKIPAFLAELEKIRRLMSRR